MDTLGRMLRMDMGSRHRLACSSQTSMGLTARIVAGIGALLVLASLAFGKELVIADQGKSDYAIVIAVDATMQDHYAAQMLKRYIRELSGAELPIMPDTGPLTGNEIVVGFNRHSRNFAADGGRGT